jgi:hypothetical protein
MVELIVLEASSWLPIILPQVPLPYFGQLKEVIVSNSSHYQHMEKLVREKHNSLEEIQTWSIYGTSFCYPSVLHKVHI